MADGEMSSEMLFAGTSPEPVYVNLEPVIVDVDDEVNPIIAVDLARVEEFFNENNTTGYTWAEMKPRVINRLHRMYGLDE